jgi:hypothetical protein
MPSALSFRIEIPAASCRESSCDRSPETVSLVETVKGTSLSFMDIGQISEYL